MNNKKRSKLREANNLLSQAVSLVEIVKDDEQDCLDNTPENFQSSDQYWNMETVVSCLEDAIDDIGSAIENIELATLERF